jgi:stress-induced morphogen
MKGGIAGFSEIATQQSIQQLLQQELVSQVHSRELHANTTAGDNVSHDCLCPHASAWHFKR